MNNSALSSRYYRIYLFGNTLSLHGIWTCANSRGSSSGCVVK
jgi:hypothetical protein